MTTPLPGHPSPHPNADLAVRHLHHDAVDRPMIVIWETTRACQLVCKHCRADAQKVAHPEQLSTEPGSNTHLDVYKRQVSQITIMGRSPASWCRWRTARSSLGCAALGCPGSWEVMRSSPW